MGAIAALQLSTPDPPVRQDPHDNAAREECQALRLRNRNRNGPGELVAKARSGVKATVVRAATAALTATCLFMDAPAAVLFRTALF
jgi:hypothetical protein